MSMNGKQAERFKETTLALVELLFCIHQERLKKTMILLAMCGRKCLPVNIFGEELTKRQ
jgi:spore maturation protein CgeB